LNEIAGMVTYLQGYHHDSTSALRNQYTESVNAVLAALKDLQA